VFRECTLQRVLQIDAIQLHIARIIIIIIIIIKNEKIRVTLYENAAGALYIVMQQNKIVKECKARFPLAELTGHGDGP